MNSSLTLPNGNEIEVVAGVPAAGGYQAVPASSSAVVLGTTGAKGDLLSALLVVVTTAASAQVQITDGSGSALTVFPNSPGGGVGTYSVPLGARSTGGAWKVTTGAGAAVIAIGDFT